MISSSVPHYLGIEIGATKLQVGIGRDDGRLLGLWRRGVDVARGPEGIRQQLLTAVPELLTSAGIPRSTLAGVGIGFGGPVDDHTRTIIKSHQIEGWDNYPLGDWVAEVLGLPATLGNDSDVAGLAEALHGAGKGLSPIFYFNVGSGIGGGFILDGDIYRGVGRGAAEFGHLRVAYQGAFVPLEQVASGWGIAERARLAFQESGLTAVMVAERARAGDEAARKILDDAWDAVAEAVCHVITLLCPRRIVAGGGVSLLGETEFFEPIRRRVADRVFRPFAGLTDLVPAALGEEVVVHGAIALARKRLEK
jgi:glucokinase